MFLGGIFLFCHLPWFLFPRHVQRFMGNISFSFRQTDSTRFERLDEFVQFSVRRRLNGAQNLSESRLKASLGKNL